MSVLDQAYELHARACLDFRVPADRRLAVPFGTPEDMPPHEWRVAPDVYQALHAEPPLPYQVPNPKSGDDGTTRLFGWPVIRDRALPPGTMRLEQVNPDARNGHAETCRWYGQPAATCPCRATVKLEV